MIKILMLVMTRMDMEEAGAGRRWGEMYVQSQGQEEMDKEYYIFEGIFCV